MKSAHNLKNFCSLFSAVLLPKMLNDFASFNAGDYRQRYGQFVTKLFEFASDKAVFTGLYALNTVMIGMAGSRSKLIAGKSEKIF